MLEVKGISASYGAVRALEGVSLSVPAGRIVCLLGANGAGKSTTLNCISSVVPVTAGSIRFEGDDITGWPIDRVVARGIVQVPEGREIFPELTVADNLLLGTWLRRRANTAAQRFERVYDYFPRLKERAQQPAGTLSGGEQQMLMIGRALMAEPKLLLLDEPSLPLADPGAAAVRDHRARACRRRADPAGRAECGGGAGRERPRLHSRERRGPPRRPRARARPERGGEGCVSRRLIG
jgi:branched-chain amino acid transport system ATP-binding protein